MGTLFLAYRPLGKTDINQIITMSQHIITICDKVYEGKLKKANIGKSSTGEPALITDQKK